MNDKMQTIKRRLCNDLQGENNTTMQLNWSIIISQKKFSVAVTGEQQNKDSYHCPPEQELLGMLEFHLVDTPHE